MIGLGFDRVKKVINDDFIIDDGIGWIRALQACDKLDRNLFTLHTLHIHFICRTKLQLQSKTLIQSQMVESSVHSCVVWINQTPDTRHPHQTSSPINWSLTDSNNAQACWLHQTLPFSSCTFPLFQVSC
ncbi:hypothetical protein POPTR_006G273733v4 [Populus trichocarpa]|uniref:Uncharacterized protein n=1 Tax=Populus trichocarpa TaxID=3694 RepID=A0ACC0SXD7_POPTR|nr:hypothetical protein POPTR_006G273733v4 [Populus trichocarpa]